MKLFRPDYPHTRARLEAAGYESYTSRSNGELWRLDRGGYSDWQVMDAVVPCDGDGQAVYFLVLPKDRDKWAKVRGELRAKEIALHGGT